MRIQPIHTYRIGTSLIRQKTKDTKKTSKTARHEKTQRSAKSETVSGTKTSSQPNTEIPGEDPDASYTHWTADESGMGGGHLNIHQLIAQIEGANQLAAHLDKLPSFRVKKFRKNAQPFKHLTLPEALIYNELVNRDFDRCPSSANLFILKQPDWNDPLSQQLQLNTGEKTVKSWQIDYDISELSVQIREGLRETGKCRYIFRNQKLEEIDGHYQRKRLEIDPIWHPKKRKSLKEEHFRFGNQKLTLAYFQNEKHGIYHTRDDKKKIAVNRIESFKKDKHLVITEKHVSIGNYISHNTLLFLKGILIPIALQMHFQKS